jgi:hypothetical protein
LMSLFRGVLLIFRSQEAHVISSSFPAT